MSQETKSSPEFDATVGEHEMFTYYVPGCCALRSFHGLDGKAVWRAGPNRYDGKYEMVRPTPKQVIEGIIKSGCCGSTMIFTDAKNGGKALGELALFIKQNGLGTMTVTAGKENYYTGAIVFTGILEYDINTLVSWSKTNIDSMKGWSKPDDWYSIYDAVGMDDVFYKYGGRPKPVEKAKEIKSNVG